MDVEQLPPGRHALGNGLYVEVEGSGKRSFAYRYTYQGRRHLRRLRAASEPEARAEIAEARARIARGGDPMAAPEPSTGTILAELELIKDRLDRIERRLGMQSRDKPRPLDDHNSIVQAIRELLPQARTQGGRHNIAQLIRSLRDRGHLTHISDSYARDQVNGCLARLGLR